MQRYKDFRPTLMDTKGLGCPDQQDWFVVISRTRDSSVREESNFDSALKMLGNESDTVKVAGFSHWACGWFDLIIVHPRRGQEAQKIVDRLEDYPVLDEMDLSEREHEEEITCWESYGAYDMRRLIRQMFMDNHEIDLDERETVGEIIDEMDDWTLRALHNQFSTHEYEMSDDGASYDYNYIDPKYYYWPNRLSWLKLLTFIQSLSS